MKQDIKSRRLGRPPVANPKNIRLSLALDHGTMEALQRKARKAGKPVSELARQFIEDGVGR